MIEESFEILKQINDERSAKEYLTIHRISIIEDARSAVEIARLHLATGSTVLVNSIEPVFINEDTI